MGAKLPNIEPLINLGINPKTGLPIKFGADDPVVLKENVKKFLRLIDEQDAVNRYVWHNIPCNLTSQDIERLLYYRGQLCFFYYKELDEFYFMPYALDGNIDFYGRFNTIKPVPMTSGTENDKKDQGSAASLLSEKRLEPVYGIITDYENYDPTNKAVLLYDYTNQLSQTIIPRQIVNDPILDVMAECIPFMRTNLIISSGVEAIRVNDADQQDSVQQANRQIERAAQTGKPYIPVIGDIEFQELAKGATAKSEEYMLAMQSIDNFRLSGYGIDSGGLFEKKAHSLQDEISINGKPIGLVLQDGLQRRQYFCNIVNSVFPGLSLWCEVNEELVAQDLDGDGATFANDEDSSSTGVANEGDQSNDTDVLD